MKHEKQTWLSSSFFKMKSAPIILAAALFSTGVFAIKPSYSISSKSSVTILFDACNETNYILLDYLGLQAMKGGRKIQLVSIPSSYVSRYGFDDERYHEIKNPDQVTIPANDFPVQVYCNNSTESCDFYFIGVWTCTDILITRQPTPVPTTAAPTTEAPTPAPTTKAPIYDSSGTIFVLAITAIVAAMLAMILA